MEIHTKRIEITNIYIYIYIYITQERLRDVGAIPGNSPRIQKNASCDLVEVLSLTLGISATLCKIGNTQKIWKYDLGTFREFFKKYYKHTPKILSGIPYAIWDSQRILPKYSKSNPGSIFGVFFCELALPRSIFWVSLRSPQIVFLYV